MTGWGRSASRSNPCAAASRTSSRSRGTTTSWSPPSDPHRERPRVPGGARVRTARTGRRRSGYSASCCPRACPRSTAAKSRPRGSQPQASAATASTRSRSAFARRHLHCRRRRQGDPGRAADVEPSGGRPRVCHRDLRPRRRLSTGKPDPEWQHRPGAVHQLLLLHRGHGTRDGDVFERRAPPSPYSSARRFRGTATDGGPVLGIFPDAVYEKARSGLAAATA